MRQEQANCPLKISFRQLSKTVFSCVFSPYFLLKHHFIHTMYQHISISNINIYKHMLLNHHHFFPNRSVSPAAWHRQVPPQRLRRLRLGGAAAHDPLLRRGPEGQRRRRGDSNGDRGPPGPRSGRFRKSMGKKTIKSGENMKTCGKMG